MDQLVSWFLGLSSSAAVVLLTYFFFKKSLADKIRETVNPQAVNVDMRNTLLGLRSLVRETRRETREGLDELGGTARNLKRDTDARFDAIENSIDTALSSTDNLSGRYETLEKVKNGN
ncbi:MAG TPA: hypothetical protein VK914_03410 [bacterium]|jgi:hypothetical protein|nr:hypothetical protein [bacterium]